VFVVLLYIRTEPNVETMEKIIDLEYIQRTAPLFVQALDVTLRLALGGIFLAILIGIVCSSILHFHVPVLRHLIMVYVQISRNVPVLVFLFFLYFGLVQIHIILEAKLCAILGLGMMGGAYMTESFRAGLIAVDKVQIESARSIGLSPLQILWHILFPQAFAIVLPNMLSNAHAILMETAVCGFIAVPELMCVTRDQIGMYYKTYESFLMLTVSYVVLLLPLSLIAGYTERRVRNAQFGR